MTNPRRMVVNETSGQYRLILKESLENFALKFKPIISKVEKIERNTKINYENQAKIVKALNKLNKNIETLNNCLQAISLQQADIETRLLLLESSQ